MRLAPGAPGISARLDGSLAAHENTRQMVAGSRPGRHLRHFFDAGAAVCRMKAVAFARIAPFVAWLSEKKQGLPNMAAFLSIFLVGRPHVAADDRSHAPLGLGHAGLLALSRLVGHDRPRGTARKSRRRSFAVDGLVGPWFVRAGACQLAGAESGFARGTELRRHELAACGKRRRDALSATRYGI